MIQDKTLSMLGMAKKAGKIKDGSFLAERSVKSGKARLVILAGDASPNTKKKFTDKCRYAGIPVREYSDMDSIGASLGGSPKSVVSIEDDGFAKAVLGKISDSA